MSSVIYKDDVRHNSHPARLVSEKPVKVAEEKSAEKPVKVPERKNEKSE